MFPWRRREREAASASARPGDALRQIHNLEVRSRVLADEMLLGTYRSVFRGSGLEFEDRGSHVLKGVPGEWQLFSLVA